MTDTPTTLSAETLDEIERQIFLACRAAKLNGSTSVAINPQTIEAYVHHAKAAEAERDKLREERDAALESELHASGCFSEVVTNDNWLRECVAELSDALGPLLIVDERKSEWDSLPDAKEVRITTTLGRLRQADRARAVAKTKPPGETAPVALAERDALKADVAKLREVLLLHEAWEAHIVLHADWKTRDGLPHLTQKQMDALSEVQDKRNAVLAEIAPPSPTRS